MAKKNLTDDDIILNHLLERKDENGKPYALSKPQEAKLERLFDCDALIRTYPKKHDVLQMMVSKYKRINEGSYSMRTAINDYNSTMYIFGATAKHSRDYHVDLLLARIAETRQMAKIAGNITAMAMSDKTYATVVEKFMGDKEAINFDDFEVPDQTFSADPLLLGLQPIENDEEFMRRLEKLKQVRPAKNSYVQDIGFEDVTNG